MSSVHPTIRNADVVETPCVAVCEIDDASGLCRGCHRSLAEIATWGAMSSAERQRIIRGLPERGGGASRKVGAG